MTPTKLFLCLALAGACAKSAPATTAPAVVDPIPMAEPAVAPAAGTPLTPVLAAYERARALLAADEMTGLAEAAREIDRTATAAQHAAIATAAQQLAGTSEIEAAREAFGEVSRALVAVLVADPALAKGQHIFECPMVAGYRKWVQPTEDLQNPYMGKKMLACGGESTWQ